MSELSEMQEQLSDIKTQVAIEESELKHLKQKAESLGITNLKNIDEIKKKLIKKVEESEKKKTKLLEQASEYLQEHEI